MKFDGQEVSGTSEKHKDAAIILTAIVDFSILSLGLAPIFSLLLANA